MRIIFFIPAVIWLVISIILLTLPANDLPHSGVFDLPYLDKFVHLAMFFLLTTLFCFPYSKLSYVKSLTPSIFIKIALYVIFYGILMEFVQKFFTVGRSFDIIDILFDSIGSFAGLLAIRQYVYSKK